MLPDAPHHRVCYCGHVSEPWQGADLSFRPDPRQSTSVGAHSLLHYTMVHMLITQMAPPYTYESCLAAVGRQGRLPPGRRMLCCAAEWLHAPHQQTAATNFRSLGKSDCSVDCDQRSLGSDAVLLLHGHSQDIGGDGVLLSQRSARQEL